MNRMTVKVSLLNQESLAVGLITVGATGPIGMLSEYGFGTLRRSLHTSRAEFCSIKATNKCPWAVNLFARFGQGFNSIPFTNEPGPASIIVYQESPCAKAILKGRMANGGVQAFCVMRVDVVASFILTSRHSSSCEEE
jgi:hypothetical protein